MIAPRPPIFLLPLLALTLVLLALPQNAPAQSTPPADVVRILNPQPGDALQGQVTLRIQNSLPSTQFNGIYFGYAQQPATNATFPIWESTQPLPNQLEITWDTTTLTDGNYTLRVYILRRDGTPLEITVPNLRIRNYSPIETPTPTAAPTRDPQNTAATPTPTLTTTPPPATGTPLPTNPVTLQPQQINRSLTIGALLALIAILLHTLYSSLRRTA